MKKGLSWFLLKTPIFWHELTNFADHMCYPWVQSLLIFLLEWILFALQIELSCKFFMGDRFYI